MIKHVEKQGLQDVIARFTENFDGLGCLKGHAVKLHIDSDVKTSSLSSCEWFQ